MSVLKLAIREALSIIKHPTLRTVVILGQLFYVTIFGLVYMNGRVQDVPFVVIDNDNSSVSRSMVHDLDVTDGLRFVGYVNSEEQFRQLNYQDKCRACVVIPEHLLRDVKLGRAPSVLFYLDGSNVIIGNVAYKAALNVLTAYRVQFRAAKIMAMGNNASSAASKALPISIETRAMWLSSYDYSSFMLYGLACIAMQQVCMLGASMVMGLEFTERRRRKDLHGSKPWKLMTGKLLGQLIVLLPLSVIAMMLPLYAFDMPMRAPFFIVLGLMGFYLTIHILCGIGFGASTKSPLLSAQMLLIMSSALFTLTGFTWPSMAMPDWIVNTMQFIPITHYADIVRKLALVGYDSTVMLRTMVVLLVWFVVSVVWAWWGCRRLCLYQEV